MKFNFDLLRDIKELLRHLKTGMSSLEFGDNFNCQESTITILASSSGTIQNSLSFIPTKYIIVSQTGNGLITKSSTAWTLNNLYLYNNGAVSVTATVLFFR
jgi:hypothetical protein